jgi:AraC family transcriptional regulator
MPVGPQRSGGDPATAAVLSGARRAVAAWPGLRAEYAWRPPFDGEAVTKPNRLEVVFSGHPRVTLDQAGRRHVVEVAPGSAYVVGPAPTVLRRVAEYSDTLEMYLAPGVLQAEAEAAGFAGFELEPTLRAGAASLQRDPVLLGAAHLLRRAVMGRAALADIEASSLAAMLARRVLARQRRLPERPASRLDGRALGRVAEAVEARLSEPLTLGEMAAVAGLSPFHFARSFKAATGLAPHQYVLARRVELAKRLVLTTRLAVQEIAWDAGFENLSHFRRQFVAQVGVLPGELRRATARDSLSKGRAFPLA